MMLSHMHATKTDIMWFGDVSHVCHQNQCVQFGAELTYGIWRCLSTNIGIFSTHLGPTHDIKILTVVT